MRMMTRRSFLRLTGAVGLSGALSACRSATNIVSEPLSSGTRAEPERIDFAEAYQLVPDELDDITQPLQEAISALTSGGTLYLPDGIYRITSPLELKADMILELADGAVLLNCVNGSPSMIAFNHPLKASEAVGNSNITIRGGTFDMNGVSTSGETADALPEADSTCALGLAYASNLKLENITFRNAFNGHALQLAGVDNAIVENCRFEGQSYKGSGNKTREMLQIEPGTVKGYPYTLVQNKAPSTNITIRGCYFGPSELCPDIMAGLGTHSQIAEAKCSDILVESCTFEGVEFAGIRFMAYDRMTIRDNTFLMKQKDDAEECYGILADTYGSMIDPKGAASTTDLMIEKNTFENESVVGIPIAVTANNGSPKKFEGVQILSNVLTNQNTENANPAILIDRLVDCTVTGNDISGFSVEMQAKKCKDETTTDLQTVQWED